jgi:hypothetical protein
MNWTVLVPFNWPLLKNGYCHFFPALAPSALCPSAMFLGRKDSIPRGEAMLATKGLPSSRRELFYNIGAFETEFKTVFQPFCLGGVSAYGQSPDSNDFFPAKKLIVNSIDFAALFLLRRG